MCGKMSETHSVEVDTSVLVALGLVLHVLVLALLLLLDGRGGDDVVGSCSDEVKTEQEGRGESEVASQRPCFPSLNEEVGSLSAARAHGELDGESERETLTRRRLGLVGGVLLGHDGLDWGGAVLKRGGGRRERELTGRDGR
jgi:hypothetical protein